MSISHCTINCLPNNYSTGSTWSKYNNRKALDLALHKVADQGHKQVVRLLLKKGANINAAGYEGMLMVALQNGHEQIVQLLLEKGADINAVRWDEDTTTGVCFTRRVWAYCQIAFWERCWLCSNVHGLALSHAKPGQAKVMAWPQLWPGPKYWRAKAISSGHSFWVNFLVLGRASGEQFHFGIPNWPIS